MCLKTVITLLFWIGLSFLTTAEVDADQAMIEYKSMEVTAYYKPLPQPHQKKYVKNYKEDVRMNGTGEKTSSGTKPKIGTVAVDSEYFSKKTTYFYIPEYGSGFPEDTGGSIKGSDRMDIFMGEGDEGRENAVKWGVRTINVLIIRHGTHRG